MNKRVSSRGIIIEGDAIYTIFRKKRKSDGSFKEYYVIPGGGINEGETLEENVVREMKEEFQIDVKIKGYLGKDESDDSIAHFFSCEITNGIPKLGGEESDRNTADNYYEVKLVKLSELNNIDILGTDMIMKAYREEYEI